MQLLCRQAKLTVRALNLNLSLHVGLTYHLPVSFTANDAMNAPSRFPNTHHRRTSSQMRTVALCDTLSPPLLHEPYEQQTIFTPAPTFPSIMSFQVLTNWWSPGSTAATSSCTASVKQSPLEKKYVSKERQLEKLRRRLDQERKTNCHGHFKVDACRACGTGVVSL